MKALERIKEIDREINGPLSDDNDWDLDHQFLIKCIKVYRDIAIEWAEANCPNDGYKRQCEIRVDSQFEERMSR